MILVRFSLLTATKVVGSPSFKTARIVRNALTIHDSNWGREANPIRNPYSREIASLLWIVSHTVGTDYGADVFLYFRARGLPSNR